jgi:hypothetical protein
MHEATMRDLDKALADILAIRSQIAAGTAFRGYGPAAVASTAGLAALTTGLQLVYLDDASAAPAKFIAGWLVTALIAAALIGIEMRARSHRHHSGLADAMIYQAVEQMLPSGLAGVALAAVALQFAPDTLWMLPGLWQLLMGLAVFASARSLPSTVRIGGAWYFVAGVTVLMLASRSHALSPLLMGAPFVIGQSLMAVILYVATEEADVEE